MYCVYDAAAQGPDRATIAFILSDLKVLEPIMIIEPVDYKCPKKCAAVLKDLRNHVVGAAATLLFFAPSYPLLLTGRVMYGLGIGFAMHAAPAYIAETAPASVRGLLIR